MVYQRVVFAESVLTGQQAITDFEKLIGVPTKMLNEAGTSLSMAQTRHALAEDRCFLTCLRYSA